MAKRDQWIKVWRKISDWGWRTDPNTFSVFMHLLLEANIGESIYKGSVIPCGSVVCGRMALSRATGLSESAVRVALNHLKTTNEITIKTTSQFSIVHIVKFKEYQEKTTNETTNKIANQQPTNSQPIATSEEGKKVRRKDIVLHKKDKSVLTDEQFISSLATNPAYGHINVSHEIGKMRGWLLAHPNRKLTRKFIVNWLNRIDKPLDSSKVSVETPDLQSKNAWVLERMRKTMSEKEPVDAV